MKKEKQKRVIKICAIPLVLVAVLWIGWNLFLHVGTPEKYHILCMGVDKSVPMSERDPLTGSIGQADVVYLISVDTKTAEISLLAIPRDTMVEIEKYDSNLNYLGLEMGQICIQYAYADGMTKSCELMCDRVKSLLHDVDIDYYASVNLNLIEKLNDAVGGVEVQMDDAFLAYQLSEWNGTTITLMGEEAVMYLRVRDVRQSGSAYGRMERISSYLNGFIPKAMETLKNDPSVAKELYAYVEENTVTNMRLIDMIKLYTVLKDSDMEKIQFYQLEGEIRLGHTGYEEFYPDLDLLTEINNVMK